MTLAILLIVAAALALIFILRITVSRSLQVSENTPLLEIQPIDIEAFRNLVDPTQTLYLRLRLPAAQFRLVQRERLRAMAAYVQIAARNSTILIRIGQLALHSDDLHTIEAARQMLHQAILLRRNATFVLLRIYIALAWPGGMLSATPLLHGYERLNGSAMLLGRLQNPASPVRISAT